MKQRIVATLTGIGLAAGLAYAAPKEIPQNLVDRYFAATDEAGLNASWQDWRPEAVHKITIKYGRGMADDHYSYAVADSENLADWQDDPALVKALEGYAETTRSTPELTATEVNNATLVTAVTKVGYTWNGYKGQMIQTDVFNITSDIGALMIRSLETTIDYR